MDSFSVLTVVDVYFLNVLIVYCEMAVGEILIAYLGGSNTH